MNLGKTIRTIRKSKGLSQTELGNLINTTQATVSLIENGVRPGIDTLENIAKALNTTVGFIYIKSLEKIDFPKHKYDLYNEIFPVIETLLNKFL